MAKVELERVLQSVDEPKSRSAEHRSSALDLDLVAVRSEVVVSKWCSPYYQTLSRRGILRSWGVGFQEVRGRKKPLTDDAPTPLSCDHGPRGALPRSPRRRDDPRSTGGRPRRLPARDGFAAGRAAGHRGGRPGRFAGRGTGQARRRGRGAPRPRATGRGWVGARGRASGGEPRRQGLRDQLDRGDGPPDGRDRGRGGRHNRQDG